jgi:hypothetical protein
MEIGTIMPAVQLYNDNFFDGFHGAEEAVFEKYTCPLSADRALSRYDELPKVPCNHPAAQGDFSSQNRHALLQRMNSLCFVAILLLEVDGHFFTSVFTPWEEAWFSRDGCCRYYGGHGSLDHPLGPDDLSMG